MKEEPQPHSYPASAPPAYPGPPPEYNHSDPTPGHGYPNYTGYPTSNPQAAVVHPTNATMIQGATVVHPTNATMIQGAAVIPAVVITNRMSPNPASYVCCSCNQQITTRVERTPSMRTHVVALLLCLVGCWPCACVPYCVDSCNNAEHYCSNCNAYIGTYMG